ncbi:MAG: hypothetical protein ACJ8KC_00070 [Candidatus Udaeobacter sp.]
MRSPGAAALLEPNEIRVIDLNGPAVRVNPPLPHRKRSFGAVSGDHGLIL